MKRRLISLLMSVLIVFALTACGSDRQQNDTADTNTTTDSSGSGSNGTQNGGDAVIGSGNQENGNSLMDETENMMGDIGNGIENAGDAILGDTTSESRSNTTGGVTYEQMLRNSQARDTDGLLKDGENSGANSR